MSELEVKRREVSLAESLRVELQRHVREGRLGLHLPDAVVESVPRDVDVVSYVIRDSSSGKTCIGRIDVDTTDLDGSTAGMADYAGFLVSYLAHKKICNQEGR